VTIAAVMPASTAFASLTALTALTDSIGAIVIATRFSELDVGHELEPSHPFHRQHQDREVFPSTPHITSRHLLADVTCPDVS
jgi:hypothetical protein